MRNFSLWKKNVVPVKFIRPVVKDCCLQENETEAKLNREHRKAVNAYNAVPFDNAVEKEITMHVLTKVRAEISEYVRKVYG